MGLLKNFKKSRLLLVLWVLTYALSACAWANVDTLMAKVIVTTLEMSLRCGVSFVVNNPQTTALLLAIYFYKEVGLACKDAVLRIISKRPQVVMAVGLAGLYYVIYYYNGCIGIRKKIDAS